MTGNARVDVRVASAYIDLTLLVSGVAPRPSEMWKGWDGIYFVGRSDLDIAS